MVADKKSEFVRFLETVNAMPCGYRTGSCSGYRYGVSVHRTANDRCIKLFAQELGGSDIVSFNLFKLGENRSVLKPCEMSSAKVIQFALHFEPDRKSNRNSFRNVLCN